MAATLRDVADRARVSVRSVSNVVSGFRHVSPHMRERVEKAIAELDYRPNPVARTLRTGRTGLLMLVLPEIDVPYFSQLARDVIIAADELGYRVMIDQTGHDHDRERDLLRVGDPSMLVDGMLFAPLATQDELAGVRSSPAHPLVLLGEHSFDGRFDHVSVDNVRVARDATRHLLDAGRSKIAAIGAQPKQGYSTPLQRTDGFLQALAEADLPVDAATVKSTRRYARADGYAAASELLAANRSIDAIFCYSDLLAIGAMRAIFDAGRLVPDDIAVIGIDDIEEGRFSRPALSTVSLDIPFIATQAVRQVVAKIDEPDSEAQEIIAPHALLVRESSSQL